MLTLLLLQFLFSSLLGIEGAPHNISINPRAVTFVPSNSPSCPVCPACEVQFDKNYRSIRDIVWTCLAVIFACTWTAIHPNVYGHGSTQWQRTKRRTLLFLLSLLMPELNLVWSVKQWRGAREIKRRMAALSGAQVPAQSEASRWKSIISWIVRRLQSFKHIIPWIVQCIQSRNESSLDKPFEWTDVHSHFLQMGGYIFKFDNGYHYVDMEDLFKVGDTFYGVMKIGNMRQALLQRQDREEELLDRSKANGITRTIVYGQMLWFGANFIGRIVEGLTITKLEVASLAYVIMTLFTYYFWMSKPLDVDCPIIVTQTKQGDFGEARPYSYEPTFSAMKPFVSKDSSNLASVCLKNIGITCLNILVACENVIILIWNFIVMNPAREWKFVDKHHAAQYPPLAFWYVDVKPTSQLDDILSSLSYAVFGAIHCIAWGFASYSNTVQWLWRAASLTVTIVPTLVLLFGLWDDFDDRWQGLISIISALILVLLFPLMVVGFLGYPVARMVLMVLPFLELTRLPSDAFQTVSWDDVLPHIG